jgi:hypothetical protein
LNQKNNNYYTHLLKNLRDYDSSLLSTVDKHDAIERNFSIVATPTILERIRRDGTISTDRVPRPKNL